MLQPEETRTPRTNLFSLDTKRQICEGSCPYPVSGWPGLVCCQGVLFPKQQRGDWEGRWLPAAAPGCSPLKVPLPEQMHMLAHPHPSVCTLGSILHLHVSAVPVWPFELIFYQAGFSWLLAQGVPHPLHSSVRHLNTCSLARRPKYGVTRRHHLRSCVLCVRTWTCPCLCVCLNGRPQAYT